jgi:hypothetical protein
MPYFTEIATHEDPDTAQLHDFLEAARRFLSDLLTNELQLEHPRPAVLPPHERFGQLHAAVDMADTETLRSAGLTGQPQYLKLRTLAALELSPGGEAAYWPRIVNMTDQADTILESILDLLRTVVPGMDGYAGLFKEYRATVLNILRG